MNISEIIGTKFICADCGQEIAIISDGYTVNCATKSSGEKVCNTCAKNGEIWHAENDDKVFAYLSSDGRKITDWKGNTLATVTANWDIVNNFAGKLTCIRATTNNGRKLYGKGPGKGMYIRLRPCK